MQSLLDKPEEGEEVMTIDEWIANRVKLRRTQNYKDKSSWQASRGTEHNNPGNPLLGMGPEEVKAM